MDRGLYLQYDMLKNNSKIFSPGFYSHLQLHSNSSIGARLHETPSELKPV